MSYKPNRKSKKRIVTSGIISTKYFIIGVFILLFLPLLTQLNFFVNSKLETGTVMEVYSRTQRTRKGANLVYYSVVEFEVGNYRYRFTAPQNVIYDVGEKVEVIYDKSNPGNCTVFSFSGLYLGKHLIFPMIVLLFWIGTYYGLRRKD